MAWTDKLPSLKGIAAFFYVATHWKTISHDLEEYRRQIEDREKWARAMDFWARRFHNRRQSVREAESVGLDEVFA